MKNCFICLTLLLCIAFSQTASGDTMHFSTGGANSTSWTISMTGGVAVLSFTNNEIDTTDPSPDAALNDLIGIPDMTLNNIVIANIGGLDVVSATLVPSTVPLTISSDIASGPAPAMSASIAEGIFLSVGTNFMAYSNAEDDLDIVSYMAGYSHIIDAFASADHSGYDLDISFSGDSGAIISELLSGTADGSISGTLSGHITAVPEPSAIALCLTLLASAMCLFRRSQRQNG